MQVARSREISGKFRRLLALIENLATLRVILALNSSLRKRLSLTLVGVSEYWKDL